MASSGPSSVQSRPVVPPLRPIVPKPSLYPGRYNIYSDYYPNLPMPHGAGPAYPSYPSFLPFPTYVDGAVRELGKLNVRHCNTCDLTD